MCEHLEILESYLKDKGIQETFRGQSWSDNCHEWAYFDCMLNMESLKGKLRLDKCIEIHDYFEIKTANELGFVCTICKNGIIGYNPKSPFTKNKITVN